MAEPLAGVRVLEVAMYGFVTSAGAVLSDWGAEVLKVEHAVTGDPQRGLRRTGSFVVEGDLNPNVEHPNRGKRSIGLDISVPSGRAVLDDLVRQADVFLTSLLPGSRRRFGIDVDDIRAVNPDVVYARGSALGPRGVEADRGGYDMTAFWARASTAASITPPDVDGMITPPAPAYGDTISGTNLAGGIAAALFARERTGEPPVVDVSLLGSGLWAMGAAIDVVAAPAAAVGGAGHGVAGLAQPALRPLPHGRRPLPVLRHAPGGAVLGRGVPPRGAARPGRRPPLRGRRVDRRPRGGGRRPAARGDRRGAPVVLGAPRWPRSAARGPRCRTPCRWATTPRWRGNDYIATVRGDDGGEYPLVTSPVQFDERPPELRRAPQFAEHTEQVLADLGLDWDEILALKVDGAVT